MADQNDSDSDWDSTLDFTSPRQPGITQPPRIDLEIEDEEFSRNDSIVDQKPRPSERISLTSNNKRNLEEKSKDKDVDVKEPELYATVMKEGRGRIVETKMGDSPPYNFRPAITGSMTPDLHGDKARPGKDRKGNIYDVQRSSNDGNGQQKKTAVSKDDSFRSVNSWDSDADEKTLQELRINFNAEKQREQEAASLKLQLQQEPLYDDPMATNRSEPTWKSLTSGFGEKIARLSGRGKATKNGKKQSTEKDVPQQQRKQLSPSNQNPVPNIGQPTHDIFRASTYVQNNEEAPPEPKGDLQMFESYPSPVYPPYITKEDEGGWTYYFGHGTSLQKYEVEDEAEEAVMPRIAEKFESILTRVYQEVFGVIRIITSIAILLLLEALKFILKHILQPLMVGIVGTLGEFVCKPFLSIFFNGFVQPFGIFMWNVAVSFRHMFGPIGDILRRILKEFATCCRSCRLVEIHWKTKQGQNYEIENVILERISIKKFPKAIIYSLASSEGRDRHYRYYFNEFERTSYDTSDNVCRNPQN